MSSSMTEDRVNMIPLIDCMFFLILFFMIVMKFTPTEKSIASLLPTDKGQMGTPPPSVIIPEQVNIAIFPEGLVKGMQGSEYKRAFEKQVAERTFNNSAYLRIGGSNPIIIDGLSLSKYEEGSEKMRSTMAVFHEYVKTELQKRELPGKPRKEQVSVVIMCFSQMSWKYAILAYDAVRAFEGEKQGKVDRNLFDLQQAREVSFSPPRIRNYKVTAGGELGEELYEIVNAK